ncbi:hypothetical protein ABGB16_26060 [Micromonospora sp. B11E3]|uniref:hypothetical protein n=1 Tax=Micromonospora sp. B11E3 TaxID=3153562 RepID=UPI00325C6ADA
MVTLESVVVPLLPSRARRRVGRGVVDHAPVDDVGQAPFQRARSCVVSTQRHPWRVRHIPNKPGRHLSCRTRYPEWLSVSNLPAGDMHQRRIRLGWQGDRLPPDRSAKESSVLRRMLRLLACTLLAVVGSCVVVSSPADAQESPAGIDYGTLVAVCDRYQGTFVEGDLPSPYRYGCLLSDGQINCLETTECFFFRLDDGRPPFEESCDRGSGEFKVVDDKPSVARTRFSGSC